MFLLKKLISPLFYPLSLCIEILLIGVVGLWISRKQKTWKAVVSLGVVLLIAFGYGALSDDLLRPLEYRYPPLKSVPEDFNAKWVVVLGGGHVSDPRLPITSQIAEASLARLVEGIRLYKSLPGSKLILSGGSGFDPVPNALIMADMAMAIGVEEEEIVLETVSKDTKDEARLVQELVGNDRFVLVTSAYHMPRSVAIFEKLGMRPLPAPTGHWVKEGQKKGPGMFFPSAFSLYKAQRAFHEYLGLAWAKIRGQI
jgi:uncharacterized SAM-binding protein YcdF (DUF218 family)